MRGQRFVWHQAAGQPWVREGWRAPGFETQDVGGIAQATQGLGQLTVVRPSASNVEQPQREWVAHDAEFQMLFVLHGRVQLHRQEADCVELKEGDCVVVPAGMAHGLSGCSEDLQLLDVVLPSEGTELSVQLTPSGAKL